jgi:hypothetical protein
MSNVVPMYKFDDHIKECDYRYRKLEETVGRVEQRLDRLEQILLEIKDKLR